jgi:hypothetical protein
MKSLQSFIVGLLLLTVLARSAAGDDGVQSKVDDVVKQFCDSEFLDGAQDPEKRQGIIFLSDAYRQKAAKTMDGLSPYVFEWETAPLDVVDSYKIDKVTVTGSEASAVVVYRIVAKRSSWGGALKKVTPNNHIVELHIILNNGKWQIIDPEQPRVSRKSLSDRYRELFSMSDKWYQNASDTQLLWLRSAIDNIIFLNELN